MRTLQLVVWHKDTLMPRYYSVSADTGWRIDCDTRQIVIGRDLPRTYIPLDNVTSYQIEEIEK